MAEGVTTKLTSIDDCVVASPHELFPEPAATSSKFPLRYINVQGVDPFTMYISSTRRRGTRACRVDEASPMSEGCTDR